MSQVITLRALLPGEYAEPRDPASEFDDFGPRQPSLSPAPCSLDEAGQLAVVADGALAGTVSWHWTQWGPTKASRCAMIGIWLEPEARGKGIGTQAQAELARLLFAHTQTNRVEAHTDVDNVAEQRSLAKAGFTREGIIRGAHWRGGRFHDGYLYSILRADMAS